MVRPLQLAGRVHWWFVNRRCLPLADGEAPMKDDEKAHLYKQVAQQANEFAVLQRMQTLGFWPSGQAIPVDPPEDVVERARIEAELADLRLKQAKIKDPEKALTEERRRRWEASKARRAEAKARRLEKQALQRAAWDQHREGTIVYAGPGVSAGLQDTQSDRRGADVVGPTGHAHLPGSGRAARHRAEGPPLADVPPPGGHSGALSPL